MTDSNNRTDLHSNSSHSEEPHRQALERVAMAAIKEQRLARRWRIFFRFVFLALFFWVFWKLSGTPSSDVKLAGNRHTALIRIDGTISATSQANAEDIISALNSAFTDKGTVGVVLLINSPGGSPVQAGDVYDEIMRLRKKYPNVPVYTVVQDMCASGAYYIAAASNQIFVNRASVVGSIGVLMDGFGFTGLMDKLGITRRLNVSGQNKGFYDPFSPETPEMKQYAQKMLDEIHRQFIHAVKVGRGNRLHETPDIFSGLVWTGVDSIQLGLADHFGNVNYVAREVIKVPNIVDYTVKEGLADRFVRRFGASVGTSMIQQVFSDARPLSVH